MYPKEWLVAHRIELAVELFVIFVGEVGGFTRPQWGSVVDYIILGCLYLLAIFPLFLLSEGNGNRQETTIFVQNSSYALLLEEFFAILIDVHNNICTAPLFLYLLKGIFGATVATPFDSRRIGV